MAKTSTDAFPTWHTPEGEPVSCVEKIKVLNENLSELRSLAQDALEDGVLMGCDEAQLREESWRRRPLWPPSSARPRRLR
jgi:hypothetical protein